MVKAESRRKKILLSMKIDNNNEQMKAGSIPNIVKKKIESLL
jgi:hypothetical protein